MHRFPAIVGLTALLLGLPVRSHAVDGKPPDTAASLADETHNLGVDTLFLEARVKSDPDDFTAWNRLGGIYLTQLRRTGSLAYIDRADRAARQSLRADPTDRNYGGLVVRARVEHERHLFSAARDDARRMTRLAPNRVEGWNILGNALFELGDYDEAAAAWNEMQTIESGSYPVENCLSRLAYIHGDLEGCRRHLQAALVVAQSSSAPSAEAIAWCFVQLGQLDFMTGDLAGAGKNYQSALTVYPDSYLASEHIAELDAAQQKYDEAATVYKKVVARVPRPEFFQALGDVYTYANDAKQAAVWHDKALAGFLAASANGNVYYDHHLAGFYSDSAPNPAEAVRWARKDMEMRHSIYAWDALAWALYGAGDLDGAVEADKKALALGTRDSHLLYHASLILVSAGHIAEGRTRLQEAAKLNPYFNSFHVHRF